MYKINIWQFWTLWVFGSVIGILCVGMSGTEPYAASIAKFLFDSMGLLAVFIFGFLVFFTFGYFSNNK